MKIAIYSRVSTDRQSTDSQLTELRDYCTRRGWSQVAEYTDTISGAKFTRSGLDRLMADVRRGRLDAVLVFKLDRLGRSLVHLAQVVGELTANRVALVSPTQGIDTTTMNPAAQLQLNVLMAVAEFERAIIKERVLAGLEAARRRGVKMGRPETLSKHRDAVQNLVAQGRGVREIARELGLAVASASKLVGLIRKEPKTPNAESKQGNRL